MTAGGPVLVVTGLQAEARIARAEGVTAVSGGGNLTRLAELLDNAGAEARGVISFGVAGGLAPGLVAGTIVIADAVETAGVRWTADPHWCGALQAMLPEARRGAIVGVDQPVAGSFEKAHLHGRARALAVDMESHVAARFAQRHGLPFAVLRVVADPAERSLPRAALVGMNPDGSTNVPAVLKALAWRPADITGLVRTALDFRAAMTALRQARAKVTGDFALAAAIRNRTEAIPLPG